MTENGTTNKDHHQQKQGLEPPSFRLPEDWDESRYELLSIRVPVSLNVNSLDGQTLNIPESQTLELGGTTLGTFEENDTRYALVTGHEVESEDFRILQAQDEIDSDDEDSETNGNSNNQKLVMVPSSITFDRHINVVDNACLQETPDTDLAPRLETAPTPQEPVRRAYAPVPQHSRLKRRWMPPGVGSRTHSSLNNAGNHFAASPESKTKKRSKHESVANSGNTIPSTEEPSTLNRDHAVPKAKTVVKPEQSRPDGVVKEDEKSLSKKKQSEKEKAERKAAKKAKKERKKEKKAAKKKKKAAS